MTTCLVTGGAGFIGSHIVRRLLAEGHTVRVLDNLSTGNLRNLEAVNDRVELVQADVAEPEACRRAVQDIEWVFHEAAAVSVPFSVDHPDQTHRSNVDGTFHLLNAARQAKVQRFVYAASSSAYGDDPDGGKKREGNLPRPLSPYAVSKLLGEYYCRVFALQFGLHTVSLRYFNVFGPRQNPRSQYAAAIPAFVTAMLEDQSPTIYGDGEQTRDFTFVENVAEANVLAARARPLAGRVINIATGSACSVNAVIAQINGLLGKRIEPAYVPARAGDIKHSLADISLAAELLGYKPRVSFEAGLAKAVEWYVSQHRAGVPEKTTAAAP